MKCILIISIVFITYSSGAIDNQKETLVLIDNPIIKETHSLFFKDLQGNFINQNFTIRPQYILNKCYVFFLLIQIEAID